MKIMTKTIVTLIAVAVSYHVVSAALVDSYFTSVGVDIPDANPTGVTFSHTTTTENANFINGVDVRLNITDGYNGDLYGYLVFQPTGGGTTVTAILLNRIGRTGADDLGSSVSGMSVVLSSAGFAGNIHDAATPASTYGMSSTYYSSDTRTSPPLGDFSGNTPAGSGLSVFNTFNHDANGTWTLFLSDLSGGDVSHLVSWGLDIYVVPEPSTVAMAIFAALIAVLTGIKMFASRVTHRV